VEHKSEIEVADFDRLLSKLELVPVQQATRELLVKLKNSGQPKVSVSKTTLSRCGNCVERK
jgi:hypothetical protein